jgi:glycosyltransferase involved in cell wall biosynthesis
MNRRGIAVQLRIVGCSPAGSFPSYVRINGFVSKENAQGISLLDQLYRESHFFIMPSQSEPYGIVYAEACSYGLPVIANDIAGPATIVKNGINGFLIPSNAAPSFYADQLERVWSDRSTYESLCLSSFLEYESRLNWKIFGQTIRKLVSG